jgi:hypothetical protein
MTEGFGGHIDSGSFIEGSCGGRSECWIGEGWTD